MKPPKLINKISIPIIWALLLYSLFQATTNLMQHHQIESSSSRISSNSRSPQTTSNCRNTQHCPLSSSEEPLLSLQSESPLSSAASNYLSQNQHGRSIFGGKILYAYAMQQHEQQNQHQPQPNQTSNHYNQHHTQYDGIIELNSTNFHSELIQHKHPFPHIKLIEYYVPLNKFCIKFKPTFISLAKEIQEWRNVLRPSAIDVSVSSNSPIAHSWSIETVPNLRIHPPPKPSTAVKLNKQFSTWQQTFSFSDLQKSMFKEYNSTNLMLDSLSGAKQYLENVPLLKLDLLRYIQRYVTQAVEEEQHNNANKGESLFPVTWPNLRPVTERSLIQLLRNHPRPELFLIIEGRPTNGTSASDQSSSSNQHDHNEPSLGLQILMELSSSAPWKAVRHVKVAENRELIEDVIVQHKRAIASSDQASEQILEQVGLLNNLLTNNDTIGEGVNTIVLVHIDDSHTTVNSVNTGTSSQSSQHSSSLLPSAFPFMNIVSSIDLGGMTTMLDHDLTSHQNQNRRYSLVSRAKRSSQMSDTNNPSTVSRKRRSLFSVAGNPMLDKMPSDRKVELLSKYIKQTYSETSEDREFVRKINRYDIETDTKLADESNQSKSLEQKQEKFINIVKDEGTKKPFRSFFYSYGQMSGSISPCDYPPDYADKLKAIRYMLINEIPRLTETTSLVDQQERLSTLINFIDVIKAYFPLPDSSSVQFIDGVQNYLTKEQTKLLHVINGLQQGTSEKNVKVFDAKAFKQELKRLEAEDKKLPEIKEYKQCTGYPCAVWRLFHTLAAFEYKKLSQIRQPQNQPQPSVVATSSQDQALQAQNDSYNLSPATNDGYPSLDQTSSMVSLSNNQTSVEHLVSPPSTTTSLSLTIATPTPTSQSMATLENSGSGNNNKPLTEADLPTPVILVMRDYITTYFSCDECRKNFKLEANDLSLEKIRQEPAEFSILWLWETHNRVNKRLSVDPATNPPERPKIWFPSYQQCETCYLKPPTFLKDLRLSTSSIISELGSSSSATVTSSTTDPTIFHEAIEWNRQKILAFLVTEYTRHPMDNYTNIFGYYVPYWTFIIVTCACGLILGILLRCASFYIERQRRHKATLLNGNGAHYSVELQ